MPRWINHSCWLAGLLLLNACTDDQTTINYAAPGNSVYGRVMPLKPETEVAAWQAEKMAATMADEEGYFSLSNLDPGLYRIVATSPSGYHAERANVAVGPSEGVSLGIVTLTDAPGILVEYEPVRDAPPQASSQLEVRLRFSEMMDLASLSEFARFEPAVAGAWRLFVDYGYGDEIQYGYLFIPGVAWRSGSSYSLSLAAELRKADGQPWGQTFAFPIQTRPFEVLTAMYNVATLNDLPPAYTGELAFITFTTLVDALTLNQGVTTDPAMPLRVVPYSYGLALRLDGTLPSGTDYIITIGPGVRDIHGDPLTGSLLLPVHSQDFQLEARSPARSLNDVPPGYTGQLFTDTYNVPVNLESARQSLTVTPPLLVALDYPQYQTTRHVTLSIIGPLEPAAAYTIRFGPELAATDGALIGHEQIIRMTTASLSVTNSRIRSAGDNSSANGVVNPDDMIAAEVVFNSPIDAIALGQAARFEPPISGYWFAIANSSLGNWTYQFFPSVPVPLDPGGSGRLVISAGVPLVDQIGLAQDYVANYVVAPVQVRTGTPASGSTIRDYENVQMVFNTRMDVAATQAAFTLRTATGQPVPGVFFWTNDFRTMAFNPTTLVPGGVYEANLGLSAQSATGYPLGVAWRSVFRVAG